MNAENIDSKNRRVSMRLEGTKNIRKYEMKYERD